MSWHDVGDARTLDTDGVIIAKVDGREIGVILDRDTGQVHAVRNRCPHRGAPLCKGSVRPQARRHARPLRARRPTSAALSLARLAV